MELKDLYDSYCNKMAQLHLYQRAMQDIAIKELEQLFKYEETTKRFSDKEELPLSSHKMTFRQAKDGKHFIFGFKANSLEDSKLAVSMHKNKQYQWLLAEAYEEFKLVVERLYAYAGFKNNNLWALQDFGNISFEELKDKEFDWYEKQAQKKKDVINKFRKLFPKIVTAETNNALKINLRLATVLIENLRHIIVHKGGIVEDKSEFMKLVLDKSGLKNNGILDKDNIALIDRYFGSGRYENTIMLMEVAMETKVPLNIYINVFDHLTGYLMAYTQLIYDSLHLSINENK